MRAALGLRLIKPVHREVARGQKTRGSNVRLNAFKVMEAPSHQRWSFYRVASLIWRKMGRKV